MGDAGGQGEARDVAGVGNVVALHVCLYVWWVRRGFIDLVIEEIEEVWMGQDMSGPSSNVGQQEGRHGLVPGTHFHLNSASLSANDSKPLLARRFA